MFKGLLQPVIEATLCDSCDKMPGGSAGYCASCGRPGKGQVAFWCPECRKKQAGEPMIRYCARCGKQHSDPITLKDFGASNEGRVLKSRLRKTLATIQFVIAMVILAAGAAYFFLGQ